MLNNWGTTEVHLLIHKYSLSVSSHAAFRKIKNALLDPAEKDKSKAAATILVGQMAEKLKLIHGNVLAGMDIHWRTWANAILSASADSHEAMMEAPPPDHIVNLFKPVADNADTVLSDLCQNVSLGVSVSEDMLREVRVLKAELSEVDRIVETTGKRVKLSMSRIERMEHVLCNNIRLLSVVESATQIHETPESVKIFESVQDAEDIDHIE